MNTLITSYDVIGGKEVRRGVPRDGSPVPQVIAGAVPVGQAAYQVQLGNTVYVAKTGSDSTGAGTDASPYLTVQKAINSAPTGSVVCIRAGQYHEKLTMPGSKSLTLQAAPYEAVWFDGTVTLTGPWTNNGNSTWTAAYTPTYDRTLGGNLSSYPGVATRGLVDQVFIDGVALVQVADGTTPQPGQFSVNQSAHTVTVGSSTTPASRVVTVTDLDVWLVASGKVNCKGFGVRRYSPQMTEFLNAMAYFGGSTGGSLIENVVFQESAMACLSLTVPDVTVRSVTMQDSGFSGLFFTTADRLLVAKCLIRRLNRGGWNPEPTTGGIKGTRTDQPVIRDSYVTDVPGAYGIWLDVSCIRFSIANNVVDGAGTLVAGGINATTMSAAIFVEEADGGTISGTLYKAWVAGNQTKNAKVGLKALAAGNVDFWCNDTRSCDIGYYSQQDRAQNTGTAGSPNRANSVCPWHTVNNTLCNTLFDTTGALANFQIQVLAYDDNPGVDKGWAQFAKISGNRFHTSGTLASLGQVGGARTNYATLTALAGSGSAVGGPPGAKLGTNYQGTDLGTPGSYVEPIPAGVASLLGIATGTKQLGPVTAGLPVPVAA